MIQDPRFHFQSWTPEQVTSFENDRDKSGVTNSVIPSGVEESALYPDRVFPFFADPSYSEKDLTLFLFPSGMWRGKGRLSKRGNAYARKTLYQIAWGLKVHNAEFQEYYHALKDKKKRHYTTCLIAVARKFLRQYHVTVLRKTAIIV